jgi:RNA polymerase sigma-70 factor, ECF subfamily
MVGTTTEWQVVTVLDADLIRAAKAGDPLAGAFLVSLHGDKMLGYCHAIAPDLSDVDREIICEQTAENAIRKIDEFDPAKATLSAWLRGFVRYGVLNWRRAEGFRIPEPIEELDLSCPPSPPPDIAPGDPRLAQLAAAVQALPPHHQLLIALRFRECLPSREIARRLGLSDDAVRQRLSRLSRQLRKHAEGPGEIGLNGAA